MRGPAISAEVVPLAHGPDGIDAELRLRVPSDVAYVEEVVDVVTRHCEARFADPRAIRFNVRVALAEALANAILYGNRSDPAKDVLVRVRRGRGLIEIEVEDQGEGFDPDTVPDPTAPDRLHEPNGRGVYLIRRLMDEVRFNPRGNALRMLLRRTEPPARTASRRTTTTSSEKRSTGTGSPRSGPLRRRSPTTRWTASRSGGSSRGRGTTAPPTSCATPGAGTTGS